MVDTSELFHSIESRGDEIFRRWEYELRTEKWKQTTGQFRKQDCFCALGVLLDVVRREFPMELAWDKEGMDVHCPLPGVSFMHEDIWKALGIDDEWEQKVIEANDVEGLSFPEIAHTWRMGDFD